VIELPPGSGTAEANVGAEFYHQCRLRGLRAVLEVKAPSPIHRSKTFRIDCVVMDEHPICAVEFKTSGSATPRTGTRQANAYNSLAIPWRHCAGIEQIPDVIAWVLRTQKSPGRLGLKAVQVYEQPNTAGSSRAMVATGEKVLQGVAAPT
jgi:hypothetical protein